MKRKLYIILALLPLLCGFNSYGQGKITRPVKQQSHNIKPQKKVPEVTVSEPDGFLNGYGYVDLGLPSGTKWAINNIGANSPSEYGDYYTWGEIKTKNHYDLDSSSTYGERILDIKGNPQYDTATANWGAEWTLPDEKSCIELIENCKWVWGLLNDVYGKKIIGPNGKSIFLPAAGVRHSNSKTVNLGEEGSYLTSILWFIDEKCSLEDFHPLHFYETTNGNLDWGARIVGHPVRAISK